VEPAAGAPGGAGAPVAGGGAAGDALAESTATGFASPGVHANRAIKARDDNRIAMKPTALAIEVVAGLARSVNSQKRWSPQRAAGMQADHDADIPAHSSTSM
jgi:hypothetical protein